MPTREAVVFRFGDYPNKGFSLSAEGFQSANPGEIRLNLGIELIWDKSIFSDRLGEAHSFRCVGDELKAVIEFPEWFKRIIDKRKVGFACAFDRESGRITGLNYTMNPTVDGTGFVALKSKQINL